MKWDFGICDWFKEKAAKKASDIAKKWKEDYEKEKIQEAKELRPEVVEFFENFTKKELKVAHRGLSGAQFKIEIYLDGFSPEIHFFDTSQAEIVFDDLSRVKLNSFEIKWLFWDCLVKAKKDTEDREKRWEYKGIENLKNFK